MDPRVVHHPVSTSEQHERLDRWRDIDVLGLQRFAEYRGVELRSMRLTGPGPTLLFLHGIGNSLNLWLPTAAELAQDFDCLLVDLPGFGLSGGSASDTNVERVAEILGDFIVRNSKDDVLVVGHSVGALVSAQLGATKGLPISGILNVSGPPILAASFLRHPMRALRSPKVLIALLLLVGIGVLPGRKQIMKAVLKRDRVRDLIFGQFLSRTDQLASDLASFLFSDLGNGPTFSTLRNSFDYNPELVYSNTVVPVTVILGDEDPIMSLDDAIAYTRYVGHGVVHVLEGAGHLPMVERPRVFEDLISQIAKSSR